MTLRLGQIATIATIGCAAVIHTGGHARTDGCIPIRSQGPGRLRAPSCSRSVRMDGLPQTSRGRTCPVGARPRNWREGFPPRLRRRRPPYRDFTQRVGGGDVSGRCRRRWHHDLQACSRPRALRSRSRQEAKAGGEGLEDALLRPIAKPRRWVDKASLGRGERD